MGTSSGDGTSRTTKHHMKLPTYKISFDGDPKKYNAFKDLYEVAVEKREDLSDVERFTYLQSFLEGEALRAVEGLEITDENYAQAKEILENRYGNKQLIVNSHMEEMVTIPEVADERDTNGLREMYDKMEVHLRSLRTLDVDPESHGVLLKRKLPSEINLILSRKFDSNVELWKIDDMMNELRKEVEARERSGAGNSHGKSGEKKKVKIPSSVGSLLAVGKLACPY